MEDLVASKEPDSVSNSKVRGEAEIKAEIMALVEEYCAAVHAPKPFGCMRAPIVR